MTYSNEFILDETGGYGLDDFTKGYIEAAFFTNEFDDFSIQDIHPRSLALIKEDCRRFQETYREELDEALDTGQTIGYDERRAGNDFWFSRNGHGTGFWDRDLGESGDRLHSLVAYNEKTLFLEEDGFIHYW